MSSAILINYVNVPTFRMYVASYVCLFFFFFFLARKLGEAFEKHITDLMGKLDVYDKILSKQKYLLGDVRQFLPADIKYILLSRFLSRKLVSSTFIISP